MATLTIDLDQIKRNIRHIQTFTQSKVLLAAKADAYGLGAIPICQSIEAFIDFIGVISVKEAKALRASGITTPILLLREPFKSEFSSLHANNITVTVFQKHTIQVLHEYAIATQQTIDTHFKIDTGMSRLGQRWDTVDESLLIWLNSSLEKSGIYTHFSNSEDEQSDMTHIQLSRFREITANLPYLKHCANSGAIKTLPSSSLDMIRLGLSAYENTIHLQAPLIAIKQVSAGDSIGYACTYTCPIDQRIGIISIGYADGIPTHLSNQGYVVIEKIRCPIVGRICMDMTMVLLPDEGDFSEGMIATIISPDDEPGMSLHELADIVAFNPRELITNISNRVHRVYKPSSP